MTATLLLPKIQQRIEQLNLNSVSEKRKKELFPIIEFLQAKLNNQENIRLVFICTHNSRRSHLSQIWAQAIALYVGFRNITTYSGGTTCTALYPKVVNILENEGFQITQLSENENRIYSIKYSENEHPIIGFSKEISHTFNPKSDFIAIMTCAQADANCPFVAGAEKRFSITYEDPKVFDNSSQQHEQYLACSTQIATELFFIFSNLNRNSWPQPKN